MEVTPHDRTLQLVTELDYNSRQVARVLGISTKGAEKKIKQEGSNRFLEKDLEKFKEFISKLNETAQK